MISCNCPRQNVTLVVHLPLCRKKIEEKSARRTSQIRPALSPGVVCDDCRSLMRAQDDGWSVDMDNRPPCACME